MTDPRSNAAVLAIQSTMKKAVDPYRAWRAEGRDTNAGRAVIRQNGETADDAQTYGILVPAGPTPGFDSVMLPVDGAPIHLGVIVQGGSNTLALGIGQTVTDGNAQNTADNVSTSNNDPGSFVNAIARATAAPNGTYVVLVDASSLFGHSANDSVQFRVGINGSAGATRAKSVPSTTTTRLEAVSVFSGVVVSDGLLSSFLEYRRSDALTGELALAVQPAIKIWATRTG
jgi:hypothetical protein